MIVHPPHVGPNLSDCSTVFDIGAHIGESAQQFLDAGAGGVISVEADGLNYSVLAARFRTDGRVVPIHAAVIDQPGFAHVHRSYERTGLTTLDPEAWGKVYPGTHFAPPEMVPAVNLAQLFERFGCPYWLKVDVEGLEARVLSGLPDIVAQRPALVSFEFHGQRRDEALKCLDLLTGCGYTLGVLMEHDLDLTMRPLNPLAVLREMVADFCPEWGNITVA